MDNKQKLMESLEQAEQDLSRAKFLLGMDEINLEGEKETNFIKRHEDL